MSYFAASHAAGVGPPGGPPGKKKRRNGGVDKKGGRMCSDFNFPYPLVNKQLDPENHQFLMETSLPTPMTARVYVNLPEGS